LLEEIKEEKDVMDTKKMMNECIAGWNSHDITKIISFFTEDGIYEDAATGITYKGKKEITTYLNSLFMDIPDWKLELKSLFDSGEWVGSEIVTSGTHAHSSTPGIHATGRTFSLPGTTIIQLFKGKIIRQSEYYNYASFLRQLGLMPG
jgi:steroid delta-isomerase-like uncharacterized protein